MNKGWILIVRKRLTNQLKAHKKWKLIPLMCF
jgi:hypothetical protein